MRGRGESPLSRVLRRCWRLCVGRRGPIAGGCFQVVRDPVRSLRLARSSYSCFMCSSARRASSGPMVFLVIAKDSELMFAVLMGVDVICW